jgi:hypothetical protein
LRGSANSGGFDLPTAVIGSGRVPHVRQTCPGWPRGVHGPKTDSSNAFTPWARTLAGLTEQPLLRRATFNTTLPPSVRLPGKRQKPNAKVTDTFTNGVVPARSRPYYVEDENGGDSVEAHVDRAVAVARTRMVVTVECFATARELGQQGDSSSSSLLQILDCASPGIGACSIFWFPLESVLWL